MLRPRTGPSLPAHQVTTRNLGAAYPLVAEAGLGHRGVLIGHDLLGGSFVYDPFELYSQGIVSNPNMIVFGQIGRGKSSFVKTYLWRQAVFGRRAWVVDPKGEYSTLAASWDTRPIALVPGGSVRLNPLDPGPHTEIAVASPREGGQGADGRQVELLASLASACLGRTLQPRERVAVDLALSTVVAGGAVPTLPAVVDAMLDPTLEAAERIRTRQAILLEDGRDVALELRRLVHGDLRGMFDGPTTTGLDLSGPLVVLDLSALYNSVALGVLMACATAWLQAALARQAASGRDAPTRATGAWGASPREHTEGGNAHTLVVVDEAWAVLANVGVARWLQASWKLSRAYGIANVAVLHRLSDLWAVGAEGSEQVSLARGLLADSETRVVYSQPPGEVAGAADLLSLSPTEADLLPQLRRGVALWKVGSRAFLVQHAVGGAERDLVDTDAAMSSH